MIRTIYIPVTIPTASTAGSADSKYPVDGRIVGVYVKYTTQPGTCVVAISTKGNNVPALGILTLTTLNTNGWFMPQVPTHKAADGTVLASWYSDPVVNDQLSVAVSVGAAGLVEVWVMVDA